MKISHKTVVQMTDIIGEYIPVSKDEFDYEGPVALCGGGPSDQEKQAAQQQLQLGNQLAGIAGSNNAMVQGNFKAIEPYAKSRLANGLPFGNALSDYTAGTNARAFAPARAHLQQYLNRNPGGPSGYKAQAMGDFEANRARGFDQGIVGNLLTGEQARAEAARTLTGQSQVANPLGFYQAAQGSFNPQQYSGLRSPGMGGLIGGIAGGALSAVPF